MDNKNHTSSNVLEPTSQRLHANGRTNGSPALHPIERDGFVPGDFSIDEYKPIKVVIIGAGVTGIMAGIRFAQKVPNIDLTIYEKNSGVGGTWYTNRYPGLKCDIPSHSYQYNFDENPGWSAFFSPGPEIQAYTERVANKYKLMKYMKLNHELVHARYDESSGKWNIRVRRGPGPDGEEIEDTANILFLATGVLSRWKWPDIPGLNDFKGRLVHSANWDLGDASSDNGLNELGDKRVGVIGVGSTAIQLVPALQPKVAHLDTYVRSKSWLSTAFTPAMFSRFADKYADNYIFTDEDKRMFQDPEYYKKFRWELEQILNSDHLIMMKGSQIQTEIRKELTEMVTKKLSHKPLIRNNFIPDFPVGCRRPTPGSAYIAAVCQDNVDFFPSGIKRVTSSGVELSNGDHRMLDVLICATGYDTSFIYPFPVIGRNGTKLQSKWSPHPRTYLSVCVDEFPNMFFSYGPNSSLNDGPLLVVLEKQVEYAIAATMKIQRERLKSLEVKKEAVDDFDEYLEHHFKTTVFNEKCPTWTKVGKEDDGRVIAIWPGSSSHAMKALMNPRWEDYNYESFDSQPRNRLYWLGDGMTFNEKTLTGDRAWYMKEVDIPPVPED